MSKIIDQLKKEKLTNDDIFELFEFLNQNANVKIISDILQLTTRRVAQFAEEGKFNKLDRNKYDLRQCVQTYINFIKMPDKENITDKARYERLKADKLEKELEILNARYIDINEVQPVWGRVLEIIRTRLLAHPTQSAPKLIDCETVAEIEDELKKDVYKILRELSNPDLSELAEKVQNERQEKTLARRK
jgi:hypothetical protein